MPENGRQHRGNGMLLFSGRCHLPNVTAVERLKSRWAMTAISLRVMEPSARKSDADDLHQIPLHESMIGRWRMLVAPVSRCMARSMSGVCQSLSSPRPSGHPRSCWQRSNPHFVAVDIISAWEKWGPISHLLVLADDLMRVFERRAVDGLVQNSGPLFLISS